VLSAIVYFERQGNADRVDKLNRHFDSLSLLSRRISAAQLASVFDPAALQGISIPPAPGWWLASDQNWYPPEQHPNYTKPHGPTPSVRHAQVRDSSSPQRGRYSARG